MSGDGTAWLGGLRDFERDRSVTRSSLADTQNLLEKLSDPQRAYKVIQVAGTNGKGSTVAFIEALLVDAGFRVGVYTSPHLCDLTERIRVNQEAISWDALDEELAVLHHLCTAFGLADPTHFEALTVAALSWFANEGVEIAVIEVGLGGLEDATNVVEADIAVITSIAKDHLAQLGPTLSDVARHKLGIVKQHSVVVLGPVPESVQHVLSTLVVGHETHLWERDFRVEERLAGVGGQIVKMHTPLGEKVVSLSRMGGPAAQAAAIASTAVEVLTQTAVSEERLGRASQACVLPGRFEVLGSSPLIVADVAHNAAALKSLAETLIEVFGGDRVWRVVLGFTHSRDAKELWDAFGRLRISEVAAIDVGVSLAAIEAAVSSAGIAFTGHDLSWVTTSSLTQWTQQIEDSGVLVTGSHALVAKLVCERGEEPK